MQICWSPVDSACAGGGGRREVGGKKGKLIKITNPQIISAFAIIDFDQMAKLWRLKN